MNAQGAAAVPRVGDGIALHWVKAKIVKDFFWVFLGLKYTLSLPVKNGTLYQLSPPKKSFWGLNI